MQPLLAPGVAAAQTFIAARAELFGARGDLFGARGELLGARGELLGARGGCSQDLHCSQGQLWLLEVLGARTLHGPFGTY